ncbi:MAG: SoxR reducing system RseC family protein [Gammaproteobacteria bacterium]
MLEDRALVMRVDGHRVHLKSLQSNACGHCLERQSCGTTLYAKALPKRELILVSELDLTAGDRVVVGIEDRHLLLASLLVYLLPLLLMLLCVGLFEGSDQANALLAFGSLSAGFFVINHQQKRFTRRFIVPPRIIRKL